MREAPGEGGGGVSADPPAEGPDLSFIPAEYHTDGKPDLAKFSAHYSDMVAAQAQAAEKAALIPEDGNYEYTLPEEFKIKGFDGFAFDPADPLVPELSAFLKSMGAPKEAGSQVAQLLAKYEASREAKDLAKWSEDMKTLGTETQVRARFDAVKRKLEGLLPADQAAALVRQGTTSAAAVKALERLVTAPGFSPPNSLPPKPTASDLEIYYATPSR